jgi:hypothetical protein
MSIGIAGVGFGWGQLKALFWHRRVGHEDAKARCYGAKRKA